MIDFCSKCASFYTKQKYRKHNRQNRQVRWQLDDQAVPHLCVDKLGGTTEEQDRLQNPGFQRWKLKTSVCRICGGYGSRRNSQSHRRVCWRDPQGPRMYTSPPPGNQHLKGHNPLLGSKGSDKAGRELSEQNCSLSDPSPTYSTTSHQGGLLCPGELLRLCLLQHSRYIETKKHGPNERTDQNSRKRTKRRGDSQPIRCTVRNRMIRMLTEIIEFG